MFKFAVLLLIAFIAVEHWDTAHAATPDPILAPGFAKQLMLADEDIIKFHFLPTGKMLIGKRTGVFNTADPANVPLQPQLSFKITNIRFDGEMGMLSFALDPNFAANGMYCECQFSVVFEMSSHRLGMLKM